MAAVSTAEIRCPRLDNLKLGKSIFRCPRSATQNQMQVATLATAVRGKRNVSTAGRSGGSAETPAVHSRATVSAKR